MSVSVNLSAYSDTELKVCWTETGVPYVRIGEPGNWTPFFLFEDSAERLLAVLGEALEARKQHTMEKAA